MESFYAMLKVVGQNIVYILDFLGILIIVIGAIRALYYLFLSKFDFGNDLVRVSLGESFITSLQFMMAAEIISTVIVHDFKELIFLVITLIVRVLVSVVVHWELKDVDVEKERAKLHI